MAEESKPGNGILKIIALPLIAICILLLLAYQVEQVSSVISPEATPTPISAYSIGGGSGISVEEEDHASTPTPNVSGLPPG